MRRQRGRHDVGVEPQFPRDEVQAEARNADERRERGAGAEVEAGPPPVQAEGRARVDAIADDPAPPTFANTIEALERSERALARVAAVFFLLTGAETNAALEALQRELSGRAKKEDDDPYAPYLDEADQEDEADDASWSRR